MGKTIVLGYAPTRRILSTNTAFNKEAAQVNKRKIQVFLNEQPLVKIVDIDWLNDEGLIYDGLDARRVADYFIEKKVDAVFMPHCNFGSEESIAKIGKFVSKPVLLWGPADAVPETDGSRYTDTQCGLFASSKALKQMAVPFTYITNSSLESKTFKNGFDRFLRVAAVVKDFFNMKIGQIGTRPTPFWSVKVNERELMEKFGIEVLPITLIEFQNKLEETKKASHNWMNEVNSLKEKFSASNFDDESWLNMLSLKMTIREWADQNDLDAVVMHCWKPLDQIAGVAPCFVMSELTDDGLPVICESDVHGAITSVLARAASLWQQPTFLADLTIRHPDDANKELLWHCGVFPASLAKEKPDTLDLHFNRCNASVGKWELKHEPLSIVRFDGSEGAYSLFMGHARGTSGPHTFGTYLWIEVDDWDLWEHKFIYGPYIHHCVGIYEAISPVLYEACKYLKDVSADPATPSAFEIERLSR